MTENVKGAKAPYFILEDNRMNYKEIKEAIEAMANDNYEDFVKGFISFGWFVKLSATLRVEIPLLAYSN